MVWLLLSCGGGSRSPHIVWITLDALRADHLSCYGYERATSPFMDRLAAEGIRMEMAVAQAPSTKASVASMITSLYPSLHRTLWHEGVKPYRADVLPSSAYTLAERLRDSGYLCAGFVTNPHLQERFGFRQGFSTYRDHPWQRAPDVLGEAADWIIEQSRTSERRFTYIHLMDIHHPYDPPQPYRSQFLNPKWAKGRPNRYIDGKPKEPLTPQDVRYLSDLYDGEISFTDAALESFFARLRDERLLANTLVLIVADHGDEFMDHGGLGHGTTLYQELVRVPLVLWGPDLLAAPRVIESPVAIIDLMPTLLTIAGVSYEAAELLGRDLAETLTQGGKPDPNVPIWTELYNSRRALLWQGLKYHFQVGDEGEAALFDLERDPYETRNLVDTERSRARAMADTARKLQDEIEAVRPSIGLEPSTTHMDEDTVRRLRSLGYIQ